MENICRLRKIFSVVYRLERNIKKKLGITANEAMVLCLLTSTDLSAGQLAKSMGVSESRMSKVIESLERNRYIVRKIDERDKRRMIFSITEEGRKKAEEFNNLNLDIPDIDFSKLGDLVC